MFLRNCWYVAAWDYELKPDTLLGRTIIDEPVLLMRDADGRAVAMEDRCCHRSARLSLGRKEPDGVRCMYHGLKFNTEGVCTEIPGQETIPPSARVRRYPVVERDSWVWIWMGEPAMADPALITPAVALNHPDWHLKSGYMHYQANYELICDNLLDFSHVSYVHANTFGGTEGWARLRPLVEGLPRGLRITNNLKDVPPAKFIEGQAPAKVDVWSLYDFIMPAILLLRSSAPPAGTTDRPPTEAEFESYSCQAVTPETPGSSHYFYSWGPRSRVPGAEELAQVMLQAAVAAFEEDRTMIESQQQQLKRNSQIAQIVTTADRALIRYRRMIREAIDQETSERRSRSG